MTCSLTGQEHSQGRKVSEEAAEAGTWGCQGPE